MALSLPIWRRSLCAVSGAIAGGIAGTVMGLILSDPGFTLTVAESLRVGLLLGAVGWVVLLVVIGLWFHYGVAQVAWPALANSMITCVLTVFACRALNIPYLDTILGVLMGTLVGYLLCLLCGRFSKPAGVVL
jgi:hypothetical protein